MHCLSLKLNTQYYFDKPYKHTTLMNLVNSMHTSDQVTQHQIPKKKYNVIPIKGENNQFVDKPLCASQFHQILQFSITTLLLTIHSVITLYIFQILILYVPLQIDMIYLVIKVLPEDSRESQTARVLLYKLFYDQTEQGLTQFLLKLFRYFDSHKQPKRSVHKLHMGILMSVICFSYCLLKMKLQDFDV